MSKTRFGKRLTAFALSAALISTMSGTPIYGAVDRTGESGAAERHVEHTQECYRLVHQCVHEHTAECYPKLDMEEEATPSGAQKQLPTECTHVCSEEEGCYESVLDCPYEQDENDGSPVSSPSDADREDPAENDDPRICICDEKCTEYAIDTDCPVCGDEKADLNDCKGTAYDKLLLDQRILDWQWVDPKGELVLDEDTGLWEIALPGDSQEKPLNYKAVVSMLPEEIYGDIEDGAAGKKIALDGWRCPEFTADETTGLYPAEGTFAFEARLPQGFVLDDGAMPLIANVTVGAAPVMLFTAAEHNYDDNGFCMDDGCQSPYQPAELVGSNYEIGNAGQLYWFATLVNGTGDMPQNAKASAVLVNDIVVNEGDVAGCEGTKEDGWRDWTPIGTGAQFSGNFDGQGHTISGLYCADSTLTYIAFIGGTNNNNTVQNLGIQNFYFEGKSDKNPYVAGLVAETAPKNINNCFVEGTVNLPLLKQSKGSGAGIAGVLRGGASINSCYSRVQTNAPSSSVSYSYGGLINYPWGNTAITNSYYDHSLYSGTNITASNSEKVDAKTSGYRDTDSFTNGEVTWLLNGSTATPKDGGQLVWYQTIGEDEYPVLDSSHKVVYETTQDDGSKVYSNLESDEIHPVNGPLTKVFDATPFELSTEKGVHITWMGDGIATIEAYYTDEAGANKTTVQNSGALSDGGAPVNAGTYYAKVRLSAGTQYSAMIAFIPITISACQHPRGVTHSQDGNTYCNLCNEQIRACLENPDEAPAYYQQLDQAVNAAKNNSLITLYADFNRTGESDSPDYGVLYITRKPITIDLNGYTISDSRSVQVAQGAICTFTGSEGSAINNPHAGISAPSIEVGQGAKVTLSGNVEVSSVAPKPALKVDPGATLTLTGNAAVKGHISTTSGENVPAVELEKGTLALKEHAKIRLDYTGSPAITASDGSTILFSSDGLTSDISVQSDSQTNVYYDVAAGPTTGGNAWYLMGYPEALKDHISLTAGNNGSTYGENSYGKGGSTAEFTLTPKSELGIGDAPIISYGSNQFAEVTKITEADYGIGGQAYTFSFPMPSMPVTISLSTKLNNNITLVNESISMVYNGIPFAFSVTKGELLTWNGDGTASIEGYYTDVAGTVKTTPENSGAAGEGEAPVHAGTYYAKVTVTSDATYMGTTAYIPFRIVQSGAQFATGVTTYLADAEQTDFVYGDTITVKVTPASDGQPAEGAARLARSYSAPAENQMAIFKGEEQLTAPQTVTTGEELVFSINTADKQLAIGENELTAQYVGSGNMTGHSENFTVRLSKKPLTITPDSVGKYTGQSDPEITCHILAGILLPGDILSGALSREPGEAAGEYPVTLGTMKAAGDAEDYYELNLALGTFTIHPYTPTAASLSPAVPDGDNGWYKTTVTITPPQGHQIRRTAGDDWADALTVTASENVSYYLKSTQEGETNGAVTELINAGTISIDATEPVIGEITTLDADNTMSYIKIQATDADSGIRNLTVEKIGDGDEPTINYESTDDFVKVRIEHMTPNTLYIFTITLTDNAGNVSRKDFTISTTHVDLSKVSLTVSGTYTYNGEKQQPDIKVTADNVLLTEGREYNIRFYNEKNYRSQLIDAGPITAIIESADINLSFGRAMFPHAFTIEPAQVTPSLTGPLTKVYDGTNGFDGYAAVDISGVIDGDDVRVTVTGTISSDKPDVGDRIITASGLKLVGSEAGNYTLSSDTITANGTITNTTPNLAFGAFDGRVYTGKPMVHPQASEMEFTGVAYKDITFTYSKHADMSEPLDGPPVDAGAYYVQASVEDGPNYNAAQSECVFFEIAPKPITPAIQLERSEYVYDGTEKKPAVTLMDGETIIPADQYTVTYGDTVNAGSVRVTAEAVPEGNYEFQAVTTEYTIKSAQQAPFALEPIPEKTYGDAPFPLICTGGSGDGEITYETSDSSVLSIAGNTATIEGTGSVTVTATKAGGNNFEDAVATGAITVKKAAQADFTVSGVPATVTYGDAEFTLSAAGGSGAGAVSYEVTDGNSVFVSEDGTVSVAAVGTATITVTKSGGNHFEDATAEIQITVNPAVPAIAWSEGQKTLTYTGKAVEADSLPELTVTLAKGEAFTGTIVYSYSNLEGGEAVAGLPANAGRYAVVASIPASANYTDAQSAPLTLTINKSTPDIAFNDSYTPGGAYDGLERPLPTEEQLTLTGAAYGDVDFTWHRDTADGTVLDGPPVDAGTYVLTAVVPETDNTHKAGASLTVTIAPKALTVTAAPQTIVYGQNIETGTDQAAAGGLAATDRLTGITLTPSTTEATTEGRITPSDAVVMRGTDIVNGNYEISYAAGALTIEPAEPSYTVPTGLSAVYGQTLADVKLPEVALPGLPRGDTPGSWSWDDPSAGVGAAGEHIFSVTFTPADKTNYLTVTGINVTLTVKQADPQIGDVTYRGATLYDSTPAADVVLTRADMTVPGTLALDGVTALLAGTKTYSWKFTPTDTANYKTVTGSVTLTVTADTPDYLTVTAKPNKTEYVYGDTLDVTGMEVTVTYQSGRTKTLDNHSLTVSYENGGSSFEAGETTATLTGTVDGHLLTCSLTGLTVAKAAAPTVENQTKEFLRTIATTGNLTDLAALLPSDRGATVYTVDSESYASVEHVTVSADGLLTFNTRVSDAETTDVITVNAEMANYETAQVTVTVNLVDRFHAIITGVTAADAVYDGTPQKGYSGTPASSYTGDYAVTYSGRGATVYQSSQAPTDAGSYTVTIAVPETDLAYTGSIALDFAIAPKTLTWDTGNLRAEKIVDGTRDAAVEGSLSLAGIVDGDEITFSYDALTGTYASAEAGSHTVTVSVNGATLSGSDAANYRLPVENPAFTGIIHGPVIIDPTDKDHVKLEQTEGITKVPDTLLGNADLNTPEKIENRMKLVVTGAMTGVRQENIKVYDVTLLYSTDNGKTWKEATAENFPKEGIGVTLPYPEGTGPKGYRFVVAHMLTTEGETGKTEILSHRTDADGLFITFHSLSPIAIGYKATGSGSSGGSGGGSGGSGGGSGSSGGGGGRVKTQTTTIDPVKGRVSSTDGILTGATGSAENDGYSHWIQDEKGWWLRYANNTWPQGTRLTDENGTVTEQYHWELINGAWYAFGADGYAKSGLIFDAGYGGWFYVDINSGMKTGWTQIDGAWYYFNPASDGTRGLMLRGKKSPDGYYLKEDGTWDGQNPTE